MPLINEETSFVCLRKLPTLYAVSTKSVTVFVLCCREWILDGKPLTDRILLEQKFIGQKLIFNKMMGLKL